MSKLPHNEVKGAVLAAVEFGNELGKAAEDGRISGRESIGLVFEGISFVKVIVKGKEIKAQFLDLDAAERADIIEEVKRKFNIPQDKAERKIEAALNILDGVYEFIQA